MTMKNLMKHITDCLTIKKKNYEKMYYDFGGSLFDCTIS